MCKESELMCLCVFFMKHIFLKCPTKQLAQIKLNITTTSTKKPLKTGQEKK